ncbi:MAG TPA: hypothetical protein VN783_04055, partial [Thermoanaerobaculia bacterium]|nr:hypothetical protein [Thermoanaerobaculia bacterium]
MRIPVFMLTGLLAAGSLATSPLAAQATPNGPLPTPLPLFPPDNWWNVDITSAPVDANSATYINFIGPTRGMHPDFGGDEDPSDPTNTNIFGMVYVSVPASQPLEPVTFVEFGSQSDSGAPGH